MCNNESEGKCVLSPILLLLLLLLLLFTVVVMALYLVLVLLSLHINKFFLHWKELLIWHKIMAFYYNIVGLSFRI